MEKEIVFRKGDYVYVKDEMPGYMAHFRHGCHAIVMYTYDDEYGGGNKDSLGLVFEDGDESCWYEPDNLILKKRNKHRLAQKWIDKRENLDSIRRNIDWIFKNGKEVIENKYGASIGTLGKCLGINNLWGPNGEGIVYVKNCYGVLNFSYEYLLNSDKNGFLLACEEFKNGQ